MVTLFYLFLFNLFFSLLLMSNGLDMSDLSFHILGSPYTLSVGNYDKNTIINTELLEDYYYIKPEKQVEKKKIKTLKEIDAIVIEEELSDEEFKLSEKEADGVEKEVGEVEKEVGEVEKEVGVVEKEVGVVEKEVGVVEKEVGEVEKKLVDVNVENSQFKNAIGEVEEENARAHEDTLTESHTDTHTHVKSVVGKVEEENALESNKLNVYETNENFKVKNLENKTLDSKLNHVLLEDLKNKTLKINKHTKLNNFYIYPNKILGESNNINGEENVTTNNDIANYSKLPITYLIPGLGGSTLIAEYKDAVIESCGNNPLNSKPFRIWLNLNRFFSITSNLYCTFDTLKLFYNKEKNMYYNHKGVNIYTEKHGSLKGINYLDYFNNIGIGVTRYYSDISSYFISKGYVENDTLFGAPYDWRLPLHQQNYNILKSHIEYNYEKKFKTKINLIGHSLGGLFINFFLSRVVDKEWKQKYLNSITYIGVPFKGSFKAIRALLHSNSDFLSFNITSFIKISISESMMKVLGNSLGSLFDLVPYNEYFEHDRIVVLVNMEYNLVDSSVIKDIMNVCGLYNVECYTNREDVKLKVYTISNWHQLLDPELQIRREKNLEYIDRKFSMDHGIPIYCVYSTSLKKGSEFVLFFHSPDMNHNPYIFYGLGDGTVPTDSLKACENFYNAKTVKHFNNVNHTRILRKNVVAKYLYNLTRIHNN